VCVVFVFVASLSAFSLFNEMVLMDLLLLATFIELPDLRFLTERLFF
jgi:hypothetical protein